MDVLSDNDALWRLTLEHSPIGMTVVGLDGRLLMVNRALCEMWGYDETTLLSLGFQELTLHEDLDADLDLFHQTLTGEIDSYRIRKRYLHADGHVVWGDLSVAVVRDGDGAPLYFISQVLDISEQRASEERLAKVHAEIEREHQRLQAIFDTVNVGLLLLDPEGRYERMNSHHARSMAVPFPDGHRGLAGQLGHVFGPDGTTRMDREEMPSYKATRGEEFDDYTLWVGADPGRRRAFSVSSRQVRGPAGERLGAVLAYQDITDLMHAMQVKDEFVSSVSHELRTPLTSLLGYLEILCDEEDLPLHVLQQLHVVQRNALRLRALLSDLLYVGQIGKSELDMHRVHVDLVHLVRQAVEAAGPALAERRMSVALEAPHRLEALVDEQRMRQVLDNLVSNAVKYGAAGGVVDIVLAARPDGIELSVGDSGIGIAEDEVARVFERFFRARGARERHIPGTGLGLDIVSSIVAAHGGAMSVSSVEGEGSTFRVTLPGPPVA